MKFLANENVPLSVCKRLRRRDIDIISMAEIEQGATDEEVMTVALKQGRAIVTFDKDFGELVFKSKASVPGIILLRFSPRSPNVILKRLSELFADPEIPLENSFVVVEKSRVRSREIK